MLPHRGFVQAVRLEWDDVPDVGAYPFSLPAVRALDRLELHPRVTFLVGENGSGKSTLIEAIAARYGFNPEGGSRNLRFDTRASHSELHRHLVLEKTPRRPTDGYFLRAESFYNVATAIEQLDADPGSDYFELPPITPAYGGDGLHEQSHGESFFSLLTNRLRGNGFYIFDEPEAALSPQRQLSALALMDQLVGSGSQLLIATHSPILMAYPEARIYELGSDGIRAVAYEDTEHFRITRDFLNGRERMLQLLLQRLPLQE
jgi:predicted ATPase